MPLYLIPTFLSENFHVLPDKVIEIASQLDEFIVENEKSARKFLKNINTKISQDKLILHVLDEHSTVKEISMLRDVINQKKNIGLMSESGCPAIADPGAAMVKLAHSINVKVIPLTGPSSITLALMASGLNGQSFIFHGYLPRENANRKTKLKLIEKEALKKKQTQIFIETPYRNLQMLADIIETCEENTMLCVACDLTSSDEFIQTKTIGKWKNNIPEINKKPAIFLIGE